MERYILFTKTGNTKWPLELFSSENSTEPLKTLDEVKQILKEGSGIYYVNTNKDDEEKKKFHYKSQIGSIYGPVTIPEKDDLKLEHVMTLNEAVEQWPNIKQVGTLRKAIQSERFYEWEVRKSESIWLVTLGGMIRLFGPRDPYEYPYLIVQQLHFNNGKPEWEEVL